MIDMLDDFEPLFRGLVISLLKESCGRQKLNYDYVRLAQKMFKTVY